MKSPSTGGGICAPAAPLRDGEKNSEKDETEDARHGRHRNQVVRCLSALEAAAYRSVKVSSIVMMTGTGSPCRMPGRNLHFFAALIAS